DLRGVRLCGSRFTAADLGELRLRDCRFGGAIEETGSAELAERYLALAGACAETATAKALRYAALEMRRRSEERRWERFLLGLCWATSGYGLRTGRTAAASLLVAAVLIVALVAFAGVGGQTAHHLAHHG
ncbi:hypothetical protein, partial [Actinocorallia lasiicapitis]